MREYSSKVLLLSPLFLFLCILLLSPTRSEDDDKPSNKIEKFEYEQYGVKYASPCEACKITALELEAKLAETAKIGDILQTSYHLDAKPKDKKEYRKSQVRLIESMETACDGILSYNVHKERKDSTRFAKGMSQTFQTLHGLVAKGVKVDLGMPYELWDKPSAEITDLKSKCENLIEEYESEIEDWYNQGEQTPLSEYLCKNIVLKGKDVQCMEEVQPLSQQEHQNKVKGEL